MNPPNFAPFRKIARLDRLITISEKIDGTNAQVFIWDEKHCELMDWQSERGGHMFHEIGLPPDDVPWLWSHREHDRAGNLLAGIHLAAGSRTRWLTLVKTEDNHGFAAWVVENGPALALLGHGRHFGEWWGRGINRNYGVATRHFSLFNTIRWAAADAEQLLAQPSNNPVAPPVFQTRVPWCCRVVPELYRGRFSLAAVDECLGFLEARGSNAAVGFKPAEGIVVYHAAAGVSFKKTLGNDGAKGE